MKIILHPVECEKRFSSERVKVLLIQENYPDNLIGKEFIRLRLSEES